jgi:hypothetical protein
MYLDFLVKVPEKTGRITTNKKKDTIYVEYAYERKYNPAKKYTVSKRTTIGKLSKDDLTMMIPNENFLKYFPEVQRPEEKDRNNRSSCIRIGTHIIINKIINENQIPDILGEYFSDKELGLLLDLVSYSIIAESNVNQYYPDYAYNHPLFTNDMRIYSDSKVSDFLNSISENQCLGFLNSWNEKRNHREKLYFSYDSTNKNCQAGDIEIVEYGHAKVNTGAPIFNYAIAYDNKNSEPLFYEKYPGSINDVSQLKHMVDKAKGYGYKNIGFILDRGYFSKTNFEYMDSCGYSFIVMMKGMKNLVKQLILEHKDSFESKRIHNIFDYDVYGKSVKRTLYASDEKERYFHIYHSIFKESYERRAIELKINELSEYLKKYQNTEKEFSSTIEHYFHLYYEDEKFLFATEKASVIEEEMALCGHFVIITSQKMTAREAIDFYKGRDASEKLFRGDKSYLGNKSLRVHTDLRAASKIFIEFIALIVRNKIYTKLKDEMKRLSKKPNYMTVPAAIKELEKIEMIRQLDQVYRLDHAVTSTQKKILNAFGMNENYIKHKAIEISNQVK